MTKIPISTWNFSLVVVRKENRFLIVQEAKHGNQWYLPAGRVEPGETFEATAIRETREEAGIPVELDGILRIEHAPKLNSARMRVLFLAHPQDDRPLKSEPDSESLQARWVRLDELPYYSLRGAEVTNLFQFVAEGATIFPLDLIQPEGRPYISGVPGA